MFVWDDFADSNAGLLGQDFDRACEFRRQTLKHMRTTLGLDDDGDITDVHVQDEVSGPSQMFSEFAKRVRNMMTTGTATLISMRHRRLLTSLVPISRTAPQSLQRARNLCSRSRGRAPRPARGICPDHCTRVSPQAVQLVGVLPGVLGDGVSLPIRPKKSPGIDFMLPESSTTPRLPSPHGSCSPTR